VTVFVGTSGWQYRHWRERFYPADVPQRQWLEFYAQRFATVESNNAFYMLPKPETFEAWANRTPPDFRFTVKVSRYLTHIRRLREPAEPVRRFVDHARHLGTKLAPVLLQLPPNLQASTEALIETLGEFRSAAPEVRVAVEFRHASWFTPEVRAILEDHGAALCLADGRLTGTEASKPVTPLWRTADWGYVRWHHGASTPEPCYGRSALHSWAQRLSELWGPDQDVFAFFNNDMRACALRDARTFAVALERAGLAPTRVPGRGEVHVG
jgi:uncharacterized protein YecE (DUF72 family)